MSEDANVQYLDEKPYAAKYDRQPFRDILTEGIITSGALEVTELDTPDMGVKVAKGRALVQGDQSEWQGHYGIRNDASKNLTIAASNITNPRKDRIIAQVYDSVDIGGAEDKWALEVLTGTPAASPVVPDLPDDVLDLAIVLVGAGVEEILNANITDQRGRIGLQNVSEKGWDTAGTFTYASPTTITVASGAALIYQKGDKLRFKQTAGTWKYFYVISVADTVLTVTGGSDYTVLNEAITDTYYSHIENPLGFPNWFNWTPVYDGVGAMTFTSVTTNLAKFRIIGQSCIVLLQAEGTIGGSAGLYLSATLPINSNTNYERNGCVISDPEWINGWIGLTTNDKSTFIKYDRANFTLGNGGIAGQLTYMY